MMKKFFLFIAATLLATSMWGQSGATPVDTVPGANYLQSMSFDAQTYKLSFNDTYTNTECDRMYKVHAYYRTNQTGLYHYSDNVYDHVYDYGYVDGGNFISTAVTTDTYEILHSIGGNVELDITSTFEKCYSLGYVEVRFAVESFYKDPINLIYHEYYDMSSSPLKYRGLYMNDYCDATLPKVITFELTSPSYLVKYGEDIELNCEVQAAGQARLVFSESDEQGGDQRLIKDYTLSAEEAAIGATVTYRKSFIDDDMPATKYYTVALYLSDGKAGEQSTSLDFHYPLVINSGTPEYHGAGEPVVLQKSACYDYTVRTVSEVPVEIEDLGSAYRLTMPACAVWLSEQAKQFTVQFRDYDNSVLSTEKVACGSDATPPAVPEHAGMTFTGWDKEYTNIQESRVIRALYTVDGVETQLIFSNDVVEPGEDGVFGLIVKTPSPVAARAWLQSAWLDDENDELNFNDLSNRADYTANEAAAGTDKTIVLTVLPTGSNHYGHRARYFRMRTRLTGSSTDIYSNIIRINTYYPITISGEASVLSILANGEREHANNGKTLHTRPLDTLYASSRIYSCPLTFQFFPTPAGSVTAYNYSVVVPAGYGEGMLTINREKHQVLFYCEGLGDPYSSLIYGEGAYEPQEIACGDAATPPDVVAELPEGKLFRGWKARGEYADDAYTCVKQDMEFDALLEDEPQGIEFIPVPQEKALKYLINGAIYIALPDGRVYDVNGRRVR